MTASIPGYSAAWTPAVRQSRGPGWLPLTMTIGTRIGSVGVSPMVKNPQARVPGAAWTFPTRIWTATASIAAPYGPKRVICTWHVATVRILCGWNSHCQVMRSWRGITAFATKRATVTSHGGAKHGNHRDRKGAHDECPRAEHSSPGYDRR